MQQLSLILEGHPILTQPCEPWTGQEDANQLVKDMARVMVATNGIGLSAPQVGKNYRMFVMGNRDALYACFNPRIFARSEQQEMGREGCLSSPGLWLNIKRSAWVKCEYEDVNGETRRHHFDGLMARCFQHEMDHLDGVCFTEHAARVGLKLARERQDKWLRKKI